MSLIRRLVKAQTETTQTYSNLSFPGWGNYYGRTGVKMTRDRAMRIATVWACTKARAETIAALPIDVVERRGKERVVKELPTWLQKPNPETTTMELFELTSASIDTDGNSFWWYDLDRLGRVAEVWNLPPGATEVYREPAKQKGEPPGPKRFRIGRDEYGLDHIVHIPGFRLAGQLRGMNPIDQHAHTLGLAAAAEEYGEGFFGNGAQMSGVIEHPDDPGEDNAKLMQDSFARDHTGLHNAHKPGVLFGGAKWVQLTIPNDSAQFLETRKFQRSEIIALYRVPPHKVGDLEHATFSNIEHQGIEWVTDGLMPMGARIEAAVLASGLLGAGERLRFKYDGLLRGDTMTRYAAYAIGRQWGWLNVDDIREKEDLDPLPNGQGQTYLEPLNMKPLGQAATSADAAVVAQLQAAGLSPQMITAATGQPQEAP